MTIQTDSDYIRTAIQQILNDGGKAPHMVGDIVLLAEVTDTEGEVGLFSLYSDGMTTWNEIGMLQDRLMTIQSQYTKFRLDGE